MKKRIKKEKDLLKITLIITSIFLILIIVLLLTKNEQTKKVEAKEIECVKNSDCLIIRGSCCSCENGGSPMCIPKTRLLEFTKMLEKCSSSGSCLNLDCGRISCGCVNNKCVGQKIE